MRCDVSSNLWNLFEPNLERKKFAETQQRTRHPREKPRRMTSAHETPPDSVLSESCFAFFFCETWHMTRMKNVPATCTIIYDFLLLSSFTLHCLMSAHTDSAQQLAFFPFLNDVTHFHWTDCICQAIARVWSFQINKRALSA